MHIVYTKLAMFSNFSTAKIGILLEDLSDCQNYTEKAGRLAIIFTKLAMFSNFSTGKMGILLKDLSDGQNSRKGGRLPLILRSLQCFPIFQQRRWAFY